ncbi:MAG: ribosome assembly RNA-binding protein YhbY [Myxococcota bacterium]
MLELTSQQRKYLRGIAHHIRATVQVGRHGVTPEVLQAVNRALLEHELIKVKMHEPEDKKTMARGLAEQTESAMCGLIGHVVILYRPHPEEPQLDLPK